FNKAGVVGAHVFSWFSHLLGVGYFLLPTLTLLLSISYFRSEKANFAATNIIGSALFLLAGLGLLELAFPESGGLIGASITHPLVNLFDIAGTAVSLLALFSISLLVLLNTHPVAAWRTWQERRAE